MATTMAAWRGAEKDTFLRDKSNAPKPNQRNNRNLGTKQKDKGCITLPYIKTVSEPLRRIFASHGISTSFKSTKLLKQLLMAPKDKTPKEEKCGVVVLHSVSGNHKAADLQRILHWLDRTVTEHDVPRGTLAQ
ncbi:hypothetical protein Bbelb_123540 [Branchiostoma belcheri]|nr:hypothetical protein Bbelb_123540 [Branchiostoma belcheri]